MSNLEKLGPAEGPIDHIEEAMFVEIDDVDRTQRPRHEPPPGMPSKSDKRMVAVFAAVLIPFLIIAVNNAGSPGSAGEPAIEATAGATDDAAQRETSRDADQSDQIQTAAPRPSLDLAQFIDRGLKRWGKFQIDTDADVPGGPRQRCNRGAMYQYFFNQEAPGTYISWFNDPQTPDMAIGEMGTYRFEGGRIYLRAIRGTVYLKKNDGSLRTIEIPDDKLPAEKNAEVTKGSGSTFRIGGVPFRRCDGYF